MKALPKLLRLTLFGFALTSVFSIQPAQAYTVTLEQMGANVVATGSGPINLTGLDFGNSTSTPALVAAASGLIQTGPTTSPLVDQYVGFTGPPSFGSGGFHFANTGSGDFVGINADGGVIVVPHGYVSGDPLSSTATWDNASFASLGVTPGTYVWHWGTGLPNQNFTLIIGGVGVPDGGSTVCLLGFGLLGLTALRRKLSC